VYPSGNVTTTLGPSSNDLSPDISNFGTLEWANPTNIRKTPIPLIVTKELK
jgi:hypothetical protein